MVVVEVEVVEGVEGLGRTGDDWDGCVDGRVMKGGWF